MTHLCTTSLSLSHAGAYLLPLAEPKVMGGDAHSAGMWVKVQLGWQDNGAAAGQGMAEVSQAAAQLHAGPAAAKV
jgi:hypothetical protein